MIRGLEKNFFAGAEFRLAGVCFGSLVLLWFGAGPHFGLFVGPWWTRAICLAGIGALGAILQIIGKSSRIRWPYALALPISAAMLVYALMRSTWFTLRRRGVRWREHFYPLAELKAHVQQRNLWAKEVWRSTH
jgi:hypothetical protein